MYWRCFYWAVKDARSGDTRVWISEEDEKKNDEWNWFESNRIKRKPKQLTSVIELTWITALALTTSVSDSAQFLLMSIITLNQHFAWIWMRKTNENYSLFFVTIYLWRHFLSHLFRCVKWDRSSLAIFKSSNSQGPISHVATTILCVIFFVKHGIPSEIHRKLLQQSRSL